jgi:hypothetical protein
MAAEQLKPLHAQQHNPAARVLLVYCVFTTDFSKTYTCMNAAMSATQLPSSTAGI